MNDRLWIVRVSPWAFRALVTSIALIAVTRQSLAQPGPPAPPDATLAPPSAGPPSMTPTLAPTAAALGELFARRPSDERLFLTPTELAMRPGSVALEDDVGISARIVVGISRRLQMDLRVGGLLIPGAAGGAFPLPGGLAAGGGAGAAVVGAIDIGAKIPILRESESAPGLAVGYDLLDVFGLAAGGAGIVLVGSGAAGAGVVAVGGANLQFNLFSLAAGKHWGRTHVTFGSYVLDNHHYLPQVDGFAAACGAGGTGDAGSGGTVAPCGGNSMMIERLPTQIQPFLGIERAVGVESSLAAEILFSSHAANILGTTGARWFVWRHGPLRLRADVALLWSHFGYPLPWLGLAAHFR